MLKLTVWKIMGLTLTQNISNANCPGGLQFRLCCRLTNSSKTHLIGSMCTHHKGGYAQFNQTTKKWFFYSLSNCMRISFVFRQASKRAKWELSKEVLNIKIGQEMMKISSEMSFFDVAVNGLQGLGPLQDPLKRGGLQHQHHVTQRPLDGFEQNLGRFLGMCMSFKVATITSPWCDPTTCRAPWPRGPPSARCTTAKALFPNHKCPQRTVTWWKY